MWIAVIFGAFLPLLCSYGLDAFEDIGWFIVFMPLQTFFTATLSGWWTFIAIPLLLVLIFKSYKFMLSDNTDSELMVILLLAYLATADFSAAEARGLKIVLAVGLLAISIKVVKRDKFLYPDF